VSTSTIRWAIIWACLAALAAIPLTAAQISDKQGTTRHQGVTACQAAYDMLDAGERDTAVEMARKLIAEAPANPQGVEQRDCARDLLKEIRRGQVGASFVETVQSGVENASAVLFGRRMRFGSETESLIRVVTWAVPIGLVLLAANQLFMWSRERYPGPVRIQELIDSTGTSLPKAALTTTMHEALKDAGVIPDTTTDLGDRFAIAALPIAEAGGERARRVLNFFVGAIRIVFPQMGFTASPHAITGPDGRKLVTILISVGRSGRTLFIDTVEGETYEHAAKLAAYQAYQRLTGRNAVLRRTPGYLRWSSHTAIATFREAVDALDAGNVEKSLATLNALAVDEPAQLQVRLELGRAYEAAGRGVSDDMLLRQNASCADPDAWISALETFARAVVVTNGEVETRVRLAVVLSYVAEWWPAWSGVNRERRASITTLLAQIEAGDRLFRKKQPEPATEADFRRLAISQFRHSYRSQYYPATLLRARRLKYRRALHGKKLPFSRRRKSERDLTLAAMIATQFDADPASGWRRIVHSAGRNARLLAIRAMTWLRRPDAEQSVRYNVAAAYARRAARPGLSADRREHATRLAVQQLSRAYRHLDQALVDQDLGYIYVDPDFRNVVTSHHFTTWRRRYRSESAAERAERLWRVRWEQMLGGVGTMIDRWDELRPELARMWGKERPRAWRKRLIELAAMDDAAWAALAELTTNPESSDDLQSFLDAAAAFAMTQKTAPAPALAKGLANADIQKRWGDLAPRAASACTAAAKRTAAMTARSPSSVPRMIALARETRRRRDAWYELYAQMQRR